MSDLISIVIPVYNHEPELKQALASIAAQTYKNVEVIVVDDGSENGLRTTDYGLRTSIRIIRQENKGAPAARNRGLQEALGEYIIFWDADVIGQPDMLEKMHRALQDHPEASYAYSDFRFGWKKMRARQFDSEALKANNYIHSTSLIRRGALPDNPWDESLKRFQDWDLWLTLLKQQKIGIYIPDCLFRITPRKDGMSHWLPSFAYRAPWRWVPGIKKKVQGYEENKRAMKDNK